MSQNEHNLTSNSTGFATPLFKIIRTSHEGLDDSDRPLLSDYLILHLSISDRLLKGRISNYYNKRLTLFPDGIYLPWPKSDSHPCTQGPQALCTVI